VDKKELKVPVKVPKFEPKEPEPVKAVELDTKVPRFEEVEEDG